MQRRLWRILASLAVLSLIAAGCGDDDDDAGGGTDDSAETDGDTTDTDTGDDGGDGDTGDDGDTGGGEGGTVTIFGPEVEDELAGFDEAMAPLEDQGITVNITGDRSAEEQIGVQVQGGSPPDIFVFPQPGRVQEFIESGDLKPLRDDVADAVRENFPEDLWKLGEGEDGNLYSVPNKADVKSLVWYSPPAFEENGYEIPETHDDLIALADQMVEDGNTPFCIGIGSDAATGWPFTDWVEDYMLRLKGPDVYDQWVNHEIPFDDPDVIEVGEFVIDLWEKEGYVFGGMQTVANTPFADSGLGVAEGNCMMHRQANFFEAQWTADTEVAEDGDIWTFYLPPVGDEFGNPLLSGGTLVSPFSDSDATMDALLHMASTEYVELRANAQVGFLSPNINVDPEVYPNAAAPVFLDILADADVVRFDGSDLMPGAVGSGSFWSAAVDITTGAKSVEEAFSDVEDSWP
jgi:alpha-glucoside transport system substrate-binding protein